jgi:hypothetical protein
METINSSETSLLTRDKRRHIPEYGILDNVHNCDSYINIPSLQTILVENGTFPFDLVR